MGSKSKHFVYRDCFRSRGSGPCWFVQTTFWACLNVNKVAELANVNKEKSRSWSRSWTLNNWKCAQVLVVVMVCLQAFILPLILCLAVWTPDLLLKLAENCTSRLMTCKECKFCMKVSWKKERKGSNTFVRIHCWSHSVYTQTTVHHNYSLPCDCNFGKSLHEQLIKSVGPFSPPCLEGFPICQYNWSNLSPES